MIKKFLIIIFTTLALTLNVKAGSDGDLIPLNPEDVTVLANRFQLESWEKKKKLRKILDKSKPT